MEKAHGAFDDQDIWTNEPFLIPGLAPSTLPHCNLIHIQYRIQVRINTSVLIFYFFTNKEGIKINLLFIIFHVYTVIQFIVDPGAMAFNMSLPMLLIVGNVPLRSLSSSGAVPSYPGSPSALPNYFSDPNAALNHKLQSSNAVDYTDLRNLFNCYNDSMLIFRYVFVCLFF